MLCSMMVSLFRGGKIAMGYQTMTVQQLVELRSFYQRCHSSALNKGNEVTRWRALNQLRVINAEIHVALAEGRI